MTNRNTNLTQRVFYPGSPQRHFFCYCCCRSRYWGWNWSLTIWMKPSMLLISKISYYFLEWPFHYRNRKNQEISEKQLMQLPTCWHTTQGETVDHFFFHFDGFKKRQAKGWGGVAEWFRALCCSTLDWAFDPHQCLYTCASMWIKKAQPLRDQQVLHQSLQRWIWGIRCI